MGEYACKRIDGAPALLSKVLEPYKPNCRYLKRAFVEYPGRAGRSLVAAWGEFSIPESCYIMDTGHFNSVEFNICYNQLTYYLLAECALHRLLAPALDWDFEEYQRRQLPDCLIVEFSSLFRRQMKAARFYGTLEFNQVTAKRKAVFIKTTCQFSDGEAQKSEGSVLLAILNGRSPAPPTTH